MASKKISDLNISVQLDTDNAQKSARNLDKDIKGLDRQIKNADRTTERYENQIAELNKRYKLGTISSKQFGVAQDKIAYKQLKATKAIERQTDALKKMRFEQSKLGKLKAFAGGGLGKGLTAGLAAGAGVGLVAQRMVSSFQENYSQALRDAGTAEMLGVLPKELASMKFALSQLTGFDGDSVADQLLDIRERLGEVVDDAQGALGKDAKKMGLDAGALIGKGIAEQLSGVTEALAGVVDTEERLFLARSVFGDEAARLLTSAVNDQAELNRLVELGNQSKLTMSKSEMAMARAASEEFSKAELKIKEASHNLTLSFVPLMDRLARLANIVGGYYGGNENDSSVGVNGKEWARRTKGLTNIDSEQGWIDWFVSRATLSGMGMGDSPITYKGVPFQMPVSHEVTAARLEAERQEALTEGARLYMKSASQIERDQYKAESTGDYYDMVSRGFASYAPMSKKEFAKELWGRINTSNNLNEDELDAASRELSRQLGSSYNDWWNSNEMLSSIEVELANRYARGGMMGPVAPAELGADFVGPKSNGWGYYGNGEQSGPSIAGWMLEDRRERRLADDRNFKAFAEAIENAKSLTRASIINEGQGYMDRFRSQQAEAASNANFGPAASFAAGSVSEYEFRRDKQLQADKIAEEKRMMKEEQEFQAALNQRIIEKLDEIGGADPIGGDEFGGVN